MVERIRQSSFQDISDGQPIVVLAPHPDDETLGCGGLLHAAFAGPGARVICMTDGGASHPNSRRWDREARALMRAGELEEAIVALGGSPEAVIRLGLPDAGMLELEPQYEELAQTITQIADQAGAHVLVAPAPTDPHCDHEATAQIAQIAARAADLRLLYYPIWSEWHDVDYRHRLPHRVEHRFDISRARDAKAAAISAHRSQLGQVIDDDPEGFVLPDAFLEKFRSGEEIFFEDATWRG
ncbi:PIG-L deacetylase family protein [Nitratireductor basaltis]|uniref:LmbE family protein n=1 Tax=Nitratireductor basaltis TaxID=472175 RepID=A0A084U8I9_9HYPH|nr:PIG-L family deacetylase [Nitratireductor basaltis]KFB09275.1 LmbE family protein [Nitratireductor basaltis]